MSTNRYIPRDTPVLGRFLPAGSAAPDFLERQQVEGYASTLSQPGIVPQPSRNRAKPMPAFRGPVTAATTREWWRPPEQHEPPLVWQTAPVPEAVATTFTFAGASASPPEEAGPINQATLAVNEQPVLTFDLGIRETRYWSAGDWALEFQPALAHTPTEGYQRQFEATGVSGIYRLDAPASALQAGEPLRLMVTMHAPRTATPPWFAVLEYTDLLTITPASNADQITQLQQEIIKLKELVGTLARRAYPELFPDRLHTEDVVIMTDPNKHLHPPDVLLLQNGDLLVCCREAGEHLSLDGRIVQARSVDGGRTWGQREVVLETPHTDFRDASIAQLRDGTLLMNPWPNGNYDQAGRYLAQPVDSYQGLPSAIYVGRSTDNGHTWQWQLDQPIDTAPFERIYTSERLLELASGELLMAVYFVNQREGKRNGSAIYRSTDGGVTWQYHAMIGEVPGQSTGEPALLQTADGRLLCVIRSDTTPMFFQSVSDDDGRTWTPPQPTGIECMSSPASLLQLPDGTILCFYGLRQGAKGIFVVASHDNGATWDVANRRVIRDDFPNFDIGYPSSTLLPDGQILVTYYFNMFERYVIAGSFFRWPEAAPQ